ncbi:MAG: hypothetical protein JKY56_11460 [Kofleriaceae bacterium]|nr:hypothetical protein [Kofleriaceae bacterium]
MPNFLKSPRTPLLLSILALILTGYAAWLGRTTAGCFESGTTLLLASISVLSIAAVAGDKLRLQRGLSISLFALMIGMVGNSLVGTKLFAFDLFPDTRYATFLVGLLALNIVGLWRSSFLARLLSLALAGGGILSSGLNLAPFAAEPSQYTWSLAIGIVGSLLILANLLGAAQREHFERDASPLWSSSDPLLRSLRTTMIALMAAIPLLLVYAWMQPIVPATATTALPLAIFLSLAVIASAKRMVIGALGLVVGGVALWAQTAVTLVLANNSGNPAAGEIALYYALFWGLAGLSSLVSGARMATPIVRMLRSEN